MSGAYAKVARRVRVPLGFLFAVAYLFLAAPTWASILVGALVAAPGLWLRGLASGHVRKNAELTTTGPYAYTRNPLYLGSLVMAVGFALASRSWAVGVILVALFLVIYLPVIKSEEEYLRGAFPEFVEYAGRVPRLVPRLRTVKAAGGGGFSASLYRRHREYNALIGAAFLLAALAAKLFWFHRS